MVKKADGRKELFVVEKIVVSAIKTGAPPEYARTVAHEIEKTAKDGITTKEIKAKVLSQLKAKNPDWEKHWRIYDEAVKKRPA
jgi:transcriptional regulator NrdR family protein